MRAKNSVGYGNKGSANSARKTAIYRSQTLLPSPSSVNHTSPANYMLQPLYDTVMADSN